LTTIFTSPFLYWVGIETDPSATEDQLVEFNRFYDEVHVPEVLAANDGMTGVTRFELVRQDPRGPHGPRWLASYQLADEAAAARYLERNGPGASDRPVYSSGPQAWQTMTVTWRMIWRHAVARPNPGGTGQPPVNLMLIGMNPMAGATDAQVDDFNHFYTETHLDEVLEWGGFDHATRFELDTGLAHPGDGPPRYCATYEVAGPHPFDEQNPRPRVEFSSGPDAWEGRDTLWRLIYRVL
jgi:hypothetical protein